uniref:Uncharacterized protein n=1 Tax=Anguilla anguilla TaxID=7936 RepID=A0A0E9VYI1_ANGAN
MFVHGLLCLLHRTLGNSYILLVLMVGHQFILFQFPFEFLLKINKIGYYKAPTIGNVENNV